MDAPAASTSPNVVGERLRLVFVHPAHPEITKILVQTVAGERSAESGERSASKEVHPDACGVLSLEKTPDFGYNNLF